MNKKVVLLGVVFLASLMLGSVAGAGIGNTPFAVYLTEPALHPAPQAFTYVGTSGDVGSFVMPVSPQYISYLQERYGPSLATGSTITVTFTVSTTALFSGNPDGSNVNHNDVRIFFTAHLPEGHNTNSAIPGLNEYTYWWSNPVGYDFGTTSSTTPGVSVAVSGDLATVTLTVAVSPANWSDIYGHFGTLNATTTAGFNAALAGITDIGLSFGSGNFFANGVGVSSGTVTFELNSFSVSEP